MGSSPKIWVLGGYSPKSDRNISWTDQSFPHFGDPDVIIIDLTSLSENKLEEIGWKEYRRISKSILDKFLNGGIIVIITTQSFTTGGFISIENYEICPASVNTVHTGEGREIVFPTILGSVNLSPYLKIVKKFSFYLEKVTTSNIKERMRDLNFRNYKIHFEDGSRITDKDDHLLGATIISEENQGKLILLPPPSELSVVTAIDLLIKQLLSQPSTDKTPLPSWIENLSIQGLDKKKSHIKELHLKKEEIEKQIITTEQEKQDLLQYSRLLYENGKQLEEAVFESFKLLGIENIKKIREDDLEDWVFEFETEDEIKFGVMEVKGSDKRTSLANLTQCNKWVEDYLLEGKKAKGIFVPNQWRDKEYPASKDDKIHFEPNELEYAEKREICIIPSCVLFEAVNNALANNKKTKNELKEMIKKTNGLITNI